MYAFKRKEILLPDDKSISFHSASSVSYSYYNRSDGNVIVSGEFVDVVMTRRGDSVRLNDTSLFPHAEEIAKQAREFAYDHLSKHLSEVSPGKWSDYFFGHIRLWTPKGIKALDSYIIDLNDRERMSREDIASHISDLMGAAEPKIPMNPMSWILEDRPVEVSELEKPKELAIGGTIDASKLTAQSISVGTLPDPAMSVKKTSKQLKSLKSLGVEVYVSNKQETFSKVITVKKGDSSLSKEISNDMISDPGVADKIIEVMVKEILDKENQTSAAKKTAKIYEATKGSLMGASIVEGPVPGGHFIDYINDMPTYHLHLNQYIPEEIISTGDHLKGLGDVL